MDLRSDRPFWPTTCRRPRFDRASSRAIRVDALIVGAGITGALVAYELSKAGASVAIIDHRPPGSGSTAASTALLQYEIDTPLVKLKRKLGARHAGAAYTASYTAIHNMQLLARELARDIELVPRLSLHLAVKRADIAEFRKEVGARQALNIPVELLSNRALKARFGLDRPGAILSEDALEVNPLKLTYALLQSALACGVTMLPRSPVDLHNLVNRARPLRIDLPRARRITATRVVIATGYETPEQFGAIAALTELRSTYALVTAPLGKRPWPGHALLWDSGDPYFYARTTVDGRIMMGGEDEPFTTAAERDALIAPKSRALMKKLRELVPGLRARPAFRWAGTFAQTEDGLPYIGEHPRWPGVLFALGYGGNGITFSLIAAQIIAAAVAGKPHPWARLFKFDR